MRAIPALLALAAFSAAAAETPSADHPLGAVTSNILMPHKGKVLNIINTGNYTYIELPEDGKTVWLAALEVAVKKGDTISYNDGPVITGFYSKSLNRTFDKIIFVSKVVVIK